MLVSGIRADRRLLRWLGAVRRGDEPGWRIEPIASREIERPSLLACRGGEDGLVVLDRDAGPVLVARVFIEGTVSPHAGSCRRRAPGATWSVSEAWR